MHLGTALRRRARWGTGNCGWNPGRVSHEARLVLMAEDERWARGCWRARGAGSHDGALVDGGADVHPDLGSSLRLHRLARRGELGTRSRSCPRAADHVCIDAGSTVVHSSGTIRS